MRSLPPRLVLVSNRLQALQDHEHAHRVISGIALARHFAKVSASESLLPNELHNMDVLGQQWTGPIGDAKRNEERGSDYRFGVASVRLKRNENEIEQRDGFAACHEDIAFVDNFLACSVSKSGLDL